MRRLARLIAVLALAAATIAAAPTEDQAVANPAAVDDAQYLLERIQTRAAVAAYLEQLHQHDLAAKAFLEDHYHRTVLVPRYLHSLWEAEQRARAEAAKPKPAPGGEIRRTSSTNYSPCSAGTHMANGQRVYNGAVAVSFANYRSMLGQRWRVLDGPMAGRTFTVADKGSRAHFDMWTPDCAAARRYGIQTIRIQRVG